MSIHIGKLAPDFSLPSTDGSLFNLHNRQKGRYTVLYFYPKDFTSGCTTESCSFGESYPTFQGFNCDVYGINKDSMASHLRFKAEYKLPFELLSDTSGVVCKLYGAIMPFVPLVKRITYLIDPDMKIIGSYDSLLLAKNHVKEALQVLRKKII